MTSANEHYPQISPIGRFVAHTSDESGESQVVVRELLGGSGQWQVSADGGRQPRWSRDGKELFYVDNNNWLVAVEVAVSPSFSLGESKPLFNSPAFAGANWKYDVSPDGRFVVVEDAPSEDGSQVALAIHITENWYEEFRERE